MRSLYFSLLVTGVVVLSSAFAGNDDAFPANTRRAAEPVAEAASDALPIPVPAKLAKKVGPAATTPTDEGTPMRPYVASLEVFGSPRLNEAELRKLLGDEVNTWLRLGLAGEPKSVELEKKFLEKVKKAYQLPFAEWSVVQYFEEGAMPVHITLDVVEQADVAKRMPFYPEPTATNEDPDGLIAAWSLYENTAFDLIDSGQLEPDAEDCVAFHCPFGHANPKLKSAQTIFVTGVAKNLAKLETIMKTDKRPEWRASATYLIAYAKDGKRVVNALVDRIKDSDAIVRNNALRVLGDISEFHQAILVPSGPVIEALHYPRASDRSKALYVLFNMTLHSKTVREQLLKEQTPTLLDLLASKQPDHAELAHATLRKISGRDFASSDVASWRAWQSKLSRAR